MIDIVPELLGKIERDYMTRVKKSDKLKLLKSLLDSKQATYREANEYALEIGEILTNVFKEHITSQSLPDGKMYFNIGERILNTTLTKNYDLVVEYTRLIQEKLNAELGIGIKPLVPKLNRDKIKGFIDRLSSELDFEEVEWILQEPVINFTHQAVNDVLEVNAKFQFSSGLSPVIKRTLVGGACDWCVRLAGTHAYPNVPQDVYKRHERCRCTVEYIPRGVKKRNVWNKSWD